MKLGTENKNKTIAAASLGVLALIMVVYRFMSPTGGAPPMPTANQPTSAAAAASPAVRQQVRRTPSTTTSKTGNAKKVAAPASLDPTLRLALLRTSEDIKYTGNGRNIFTAQVEIPKIVQAPVQTPVVQQAPPPPPPPPPFPLKFFGFASKPGEPKRIFLSSNEGDVFIAAEGDIVNRRYKVVRISPSSVEVEDVLNNVRQNIPLTQG